MPVSKRAEDPATPTAADANWLAAVNSPIRRLALNVGLVFAFVQFTKLHEIVSLALNTNSYLLNVVGIPALVFAFIGGAFRIALRYRVTWLWIWFVGFLVLSVPFSTWKSESLKLVFNYIRTDWILLFVIGGLIMTWSEVLRFTTMLAWSAAANIVIGRIFMRSSGGRIDLVGGTMANANDFAALLVLLMPFLLWVVFSPERFFVLRLAAGITFFSCLYFTLATGSRGALVAILITTAYCWLKIGPAAKLALLVLVTGGALCYVVILPSTVITRLSTVFQRTSKMVNEYTPEGEAVASAESRSYLLWQSLVTTAKHPLLGIGPGEFSNFEGSMAKQQGLRGNWHDTHNSYTQISSEAGIPAALCLIAAIVSTYLMIARPYKQVRRLPVTPQTRHIRLTLLCMLMSIVGFCAAIFFLSLAYRFYLPALTGMAIATTTAIHYDPKVQQLFAKARV